MIDAFFLRKANEFYLWLLDWTGVYAASVAAISALISPIFFSPIRTFHLLIIIPNLIICVPYYLDQDKERYTKYNARALLLQESTMRRIACLALLVLTVIEFSGAVFFLFAGGFDAAMKMGFFARGWNSLMLVVYMYSLAVCIREREPKSWFKKSELAMSRSR